MEGLDRLFNKLYGVKLCLSEPLPGELWHKDVYKLSVREIDSDDELGIIYCDFFTRTGKPHQDCHFTIRGGRLRDHDNSYQNPVVVLMLNLPPPGWSRPTLLSGSMMDNLFHEMGHAMHSMLARTKYQHVTGTRCSTDFAEVPSTLMEYFAADSRVLHDISHHYQTGEKLPMETLEKYIASRKVFMGPDIQSQLCYSMLDQKLHGHHPLDCTTTEVMQMIHSEHHNLPFPEGTAWQHRFSHLVKIFSYFFSHKQKSWPLISRWGMELDITAIYWPDPWHRTSGRSFSKKILSTPKKVHFSGKNVFLMEEANLVQTLFLTFWVTPLNLVSLWTHF